MTPEQKAADENLRLAIEQHRKAHLLADPEFDPDWLKESLAEYLVISCHVRDDGQGGLDGLYHFGMPDNYLLPHRFRGLLAEARHIMDVHCLPSSDA